MKKLVAAAYVCMAATGFAQGRPEPVVGVEKPAEVKEGEPKSYVGVLKASERVSVTAQVAGKIWKQNFREGGRVGKSDLLHFVFRALFIQ